MARVESLPCPHCGQSCRLTVEYLSQFGGGTTDCTSCGQPFVLPHVDEVFDPTDQTAARAASAALDYQTSNNATVLSYAGDPLASAAWREGGRAVVARRGDLPRRCYLCNGPTTTVPITLRLSWSPPTGVRGFSRAAALKHLVLYVADRRHFPLRIYACPAHARRLGRNRRIGNVVVALAATAFVVTVGCLFKMRNPPLAVWVAVPASLGCVPLGFLVRRLTTGLPAADHIGAADARVSGFGSDFLASLPPIEAALAAKAARAEARAGLFVVDDEAEHQG